MNKREMITRGLETAFIDSNIKSNLAYKPQFILNNHKEGRKVLSSIEDELLRCNEFYISVAFITMSGITPLLGTLKELETRGIKGRILTTDYLNFTEPRAITKLAQLENIELKMYASKDVGFCAKGYIFKKEEEFRIIVGSSNMTSSALTRNMEWNTKIISTEQGEYAKQILAEFDNLWDSKETLLYDDFIDGYREFYERAKKQREIIEKQKEIAVTGEIVDFNKYKLQPNKMQVEFIQNLEKMRNSGENRALLLSATGTGKTYAAAFALREMNPKKALFLVHREQIAKQAIKSFKNVFGNNIKFGLLSGTSKETDSDYLFSTMQMMAKSEVREQFAPNEFDVIIVDEVHRAGANSYQKILEYFTPGFYLGMTASPDRTDGFDVYNLFDHNIAHEIRLQQAMEEDLLCPFHYFGITDLVVGDQEVSDKKDFREFNQLVSDERVDYVIDKAKYYGHAGDRVKGLIFCSRKIEADELSIKFNQHGYNTAVLGGSDSQEVREKMIERLTDNHHVDGTLDYIFTVDIFNEGVDIPEINQVIMLRPTESPIVFIQQLGRGLRKSENKKYVVILDFIGNYTNNFMIPIALSGDRTYNKDNIRRYVMEGERVIPGSSTIHFDEISKKRIYQSIDAANFSDIRLIKENYTNLKNKLGRIPRLEDFEKYGEMDVVRIFDNNSLGSYYKFLLKYEKEYKVRLNLEEEKVIEFISKKLANGKRIHELELLRCMLAYESRLLEVFTRTMRVEHSIEVSEVTINNVVNVMTNEFPTGGSKKTYETCVLLEPNGEREYKLASGFATMLTNIDFREMLEELITFGIDRCENNYYNRYEDTSFQLYQKYTYEDACRLLEWSHNEVPLNIGGYKYDKNTKTFPVSINYYKEEDISDTTKYEDHFISSNHLIAISKQGRTIESEDVQNFLYAKDRGIEVELFIRKNKDDKCSKEFYYLGRMAATGNAKEFVMENTTKTAVEIEWILDTPVREDIYEYIISE